MEDALVENAVVVEAQNNENAQQNMDVMIEARSSDAQQGTKDSVAQ